MVKHLSSIHRKSKLLDVRCFPDGLIRYNAVCVDESRVPSDQSLCFISEFQ